MHTTLTREENELLTQVGSGTPMGELRWKMDTVAQQDHMAGETQGPIADRTLERLSHSDRAVVFLRQLIMENIEKVMQGMDPLAVIHDPDHSIIDTNMSQDLHFSGGRTGAGRPYGLTTETVSPRARQ